MGLKNHTERKDLKNLVESIDLLTMDLYSKKLETFEQFFTDFTLIYSSAI